MSWDEIGAIEEAKKVINCVAETRGRYGLTVVPGTLTGADRARLRELGAVDYRSYGTLQGRSRCRPISYLMTRL